MQFDKSSIGDTVSGFFIQGKFGTKGNFETVIPGRAVPGLVHYWRNNDNPSLPWSGPTRFASSIGNVDGGVTLIQSNFGSPGNLEIVVVVAGKLLHLWRDSGPSFTWSAPFTIASGVSGIPGLIQSRFGSKGNFEVVVPVSGGGLVHYWRNNDIPSLPWSAPTPFGKSLGSVAAVSLIQSNFGSPGNLEVVASASGQVYHFWRDSGPSFAWNGPFILAGIFGIPSLIQGRFGQGNFELVVSSASGGLVHYWRDNGSSSFPWSGPTPFDLGPQFGAPSLIESNFGDPGNLEVLAGTFASGTELTHSWRDSGPSFTWHGPSVVETGV
jgi:hypothetical protein